MRFEELLSWCAALGVVAMAILTVNSLAIAALTRKKLLRRRTSIFLISLACADLIVGMFSVPMYIYQLVTRWKDPTSLSTRSTIFKAYQVIDIFSGLASVFTLTAIALERTYAIGWPLKHRAYNPKFYSILLSSVWILASFLSALYLLFQYELLQLRVFFYFMMATLFLSTFVMIIAYVIIWIKARELRKEYKNRRSRRLFQRTTEKERRLAMTLFIVTAVFIFTWMPFQILNIIFFFTCTSFPCGPPDTVIYFCKLLHYANSFLNPAIYSTRIPDFWKAMKKMLLCKC